MPTDGNIDVSLYVTRTYALLRLRYLQKIVLWILLLACFTAMPISPLIAQVQPEAAKPLPDFILLAQISGFIPFDGGYRINYRTSLAGLPVEIAGGICFPITSNLSSLADFQYKRRTALFVPDFRIKTLEIELGVRDYLEKEHENDLRLYSSAGLLLGKSSVTGNIDATRDGKNISTIEVLNDYYNIGLGLGLGVEYPITKNSDIYAGIHLEIYFADPVTTGGLGNIGGVSVGLGYRINFGS
jgi:hypothetical protein